MPRQAGEALKPPFVLGGREVLVTASAGVVLGRPGGAAAQEGRVDPQDLLRSSDVAVYRAKEGGKDHHTSLSSHRWAGAPDEAWRPGRAQGLLWSAAS